MKTNTEVREVLNDLLSWSEYMGGSEAACWDRARKFRDSLFEENVPHTPGPFQAGEPFECEDPNIQENGAQRFTPIYAPAGCIAWVCNDEGDPEGPANVALFLAAPKLLSNLKDMQRAYGELHDGLSDMIEGGRLMEESIPDDYRWLAESLVNTISIDDAVQAVIKQAKGE